MGIRQEHGKVLKLQVVQALYGMIPYHERAQHEASFESAYRHILGETWDETGLSMESVDGLGHYLRGVHSAKGTPVRINQGKVMRGLALRTLSLESRLEGFKPTALATALMESSMEGETSQLMARYGLGSVSLEADQPSAWKNLGKMIAGLFKGKEKAKEEPFDYRKVDYSNVFKMADYLHTDAKLIYHMKQDSVEGKISGEGIVQNLSWGSEFDEKDPVGFLKRKFGEWEKFYHQHEAAVDKMSKFIQHDEDTTRPACVKVKDDVDAMDKILEAACHTLLAMDNPTKLAGKLKPVWPGAWVYSEYKRSSVEFNMAERKHAPDFKDRKEIRPLKTEEAQQLVAWLRDTVRDMKKYMTIYDKAKWSDHSDGDEFWRITDDCSWQDTYAGLIYWQSCDQDFIDGMPQIDDILVHLSRGIMNWVDRSFPNR